MPIIEQSRSDEEFDKRLNAQLLTGGDPFSIDNVDRPLRSSLLCQAITETELTLRELGKGRNVTVLNFATVFATGNNLTFAGDIAARRAILSRLDPNCERPERREFKRDPLARAKLNRGVYAAAVLTMLRAYHIADDKVDVAPIAGFQEWCLRVRNVLIWLDQADPCETMTAIQGDDPSARGLAEVMMQWKLVMGLDRKVTAREVIEMAIKSDGDRYFLHPDLRNALLEVAAHKDGKQISANRLGWWLRQKEGRVAGAHKFVRAGNDGDANVALWVLKCA
jgi:hypothetical protein